MKIFPFKAIYPNVDLIASTDSFFSTVRDDYVQYYQNGFFNTADDLHGGIHAHVGTDERFFEVVEHFIIHGAFSGNGFGDLRQKSLLGFFQSLVERFLFFLAK